MKDAWQTRWLWLVVAMIVAALAPLACSGDDAASASGTGHGGGTSTSSGLGFGGNDSLQSLSIDPPTASIECLNGATATQQFNATLDHGDGTKETLTSGVSWSATAPQVGSIDATGLYTANGTLGDVVTITAEYAGSKATAVLTVKVHLQQDPTSVPPTVKMALDGASTPDASVVWAYPYDGTVWPRGLLPPLLMWNGGAPTDQVLVHLENPTFELEAYLVPSNAPSSQVALDAATWQTFVDSSSGKTALTVARWDGQAATVVASHTWTIAPASMRGTIYYWSNNLGRVLRIKPGAATPDDFANQAPLNDPNQYVQSSCLMTCHTVSADGSTIVSGGGTFGGSYNLLTGQPTYYTGGTWGPVTNGTNVRWMMPALSPTGKYILLNSMGTGIAQAADGTPNPAGLFTTADAQPVPNSGADGIPMAMPTWSPEGSRIAFVDSGDSAAWGSWIDPPPGDLKVYSFDEKKSPMISNLQTLVSTGADPAVRIAWPTITPDGKWVLYARTAGADTRTGNSDLYFSSATTPNQEVRLATLDGDSYPFAAGARDLGWNFEPSFAPVAAGGYFWVVFTSRRTYGNLLTGDKTVVKQLWVAAIDLAPQPGKDPSHPAFHLTGQDEQNLAMRGFWALDPCKGDGQGCASGTECCGGYCDMSGDPDAGGPVCVSMTGGCAQDGDKCDTSADCCDAPQGVTCINHVCSEPPPK